MRVRIAELADEAGLTYKAVAKGLDVSERTLYFWNTGTVMPNRSNAGRIQRFFNKKKLGEIYD